MASGVISSILGDGFKISNYFDAASLLVDLIADDSFDCGAAFSLAYLMLS